MHILGDTTTRITPAADQRICGANHISVEESGRPDLARNKGASQDTDEKANGVEAGRVVCSTSKCGGDGTNQETTDKGETWAKSIAQRTSNGSHHKCRRQ